MVRQAGTFAVVGVVATLVHYGTIVVLVDGLGLMTPTRATVLGSIVGIFTSYLGNHLLVFGASGNHLQYGARFGVVYLMAMGLHGGLMYLCTDLMHLGYTWGFGSATIVSAALTFLANRYFVFRDPEAECPGSPGPESCGLQPRKLMDPETERGAGL